MYVCNGGDAMVVQNAGYINNNIIHHFTYKIFASSWWNTPVCPLETLDILYRENSQSCKHKCV